MGILLAFAPFIAFVIVERLVGVTTGLISATVISILLFVPLENLEISERTGVILPSQFSPPMLISLTALLITLSSIFRSRASLELENLALRHQIGVLQRSARKRPKLTPVDRL